MLGFQKSAGTLDIFQIFQPVHPDQKPQRAYQLPQHLRQPQQLLHTQHHSLSRQPSQPLMREHTWRNEKPEHTRLHRRVLSNQPYSHSSHDEPPAPDYDLPEDWDHLEDEYGKEYEAYMLQLEAKSYPIVAHMETQPEITWEMRPVLLDFLVQVHSQYRLRPETFFLAVNMMDRYLSRRIVRRVHYQLLGMACLWVAAKYEDVKDNVPSVHDLWFMCQSAYSEKEFVMMEAHVVHCLQFDLGHPTQEAWMKYFLAKGEVKTKEDVPGWGDACRWGFGREDRKRVHDLARFITEVACFHRPFVAWAPSVLAKSALHLAVHILGLPQPSLQSIRQYFPYIYQLEAILPSTTAVVLHKYSHKCLSNATEAVKSYLSSSSTMRPATTLWSSPRRQFGGAEVWLEKSRTCGSWVTQEVVHAGDSATVQLLRRETFSETQTERRQQQEHCPHQQQHQQGTGSQCDPFTAAMILPRAVAACAPPTPVTPSMIVDSGTEISQWARGDAWKFYAVQDRRAHFPNIGISSALYNCSHSVDPKPRGIRTTDEWRAAYPLPVFSASMTAARDTCAWDDCAVSHGCSLERVPNLPLFLGHPASCVRLCLPLRSST